LVKGAVGSSAFAARQGLSLEHTTLVGFSILVVERDADREHYLRRTLYGAGAHVLAPRTSKDAIRIVDELELSAAVLDYNESQASRHVLAMRLTDLRIPFIFCADAGQTCVPLVIPVLYRPTIGSELIEMLRQLLQPPLTRATATAILPIGSSTRRTSLAAREPRPAPQSTKVQREGDAWW
jgi:CheY-like chemotaxis protein